MGEPPFGERIDAGVLTNLRFERGLALARVVALEAERDALRDAYGGVVKQMQAVLVAIDEGCAKFPVGLSHLAGMAQAMRNYIQGDQEELARAASVSKEEAR